MKNYGKMMKQFQKMQGDMARVQEELAQEIVEASAGGAVKVAVNGKQEIVRIELDPSAVDPEDVEMLQDLIVVACNEALRQSQELASQRMSGLTAGLGLPGMP